jgi:hypothetical protein
MQVAGDLRWDRHLLPGGLTSDPVLGDQLTVVLVAVAAAALAVALFGDGAARTPALASLAALVLCTPIAAPLYRLVPGFALLPFPWRWLGPATCLALLAIAAVDRPAARRRWSSSCAARGPTGVALAARTARRRPGGGR